jgi:hypothetical protein
VDLLYYDDSIPHLCQKHLVGIRSDDGRKH